MGWATNRGWPGVPEDRQAQFLARLYMCSRWLSRNIEKLFWYDFRNHSLPSAPYDQPVYNDAYHELLRRSFPLDPNDPTLRKPGFLAYRVITGALSGLALSEVAADGRRGDMPSTYWYRFGRRAACRCAVEHRRRQPGGADCLRLPRGAGAPLERARTLPDLP